MYAAIYYLECAFVARREKRRQVHDGLNAVRKSNKTESVELFIGLDGNGFCGTHFMGP